MVAVKWFLVFLMLKTDSVLVITLLFFNFIIYAEILTEGEDFESKSYREKSSSC